MRRLKLELKQTMEMYNTACKEALTAQQKVRINVSICSLSLQIYQFSLSAPIYKSETCFAICMAGSRTSKMEVRRRKEIGRGEGSRGSCIGNC